MHHVAGTISKTSVIGIYADRASCDKEECSDEKIACASILWHVAGRLPGQEEPNALQRLLIDDLTKWMDEVHVADSAHGLDRPAFVYTNVSARQTIVFLACEAYEGGTTSWSIDDSFRALTNKVESCLFNRS